MGTDIKDIGSTHTADIFQKSSKFFQKSLDIFGNPRYNSEAVERNAAIAQPVERILGKDEVASSNLASSSKTPDSEKNQEFSFIPLRRFELAKPVKIWPNGAALPVAEAAVPLVCSGRRGTQVIYHQGHSPGTANRIAAPQLRQSRY